MNRTVVTAQSGLILADKYRIQDTFVSGLGEVEDIGGRCYRLSFYSTQCIEGREEAVVVAKLVAPMEAVPPAIMLAAKAVGWSLAAGAYFPRIGLH